VSDPTYRVEIEHLPGELLPYYARIFQLSNDLGMPCNSFHGDDPEELADLCRAWIAAQNAKQETVRFFTDDSGDVVRLPRAAGHSVKA
jgi:hypothetical protein